MRGQRNADNGHACRCMIQVAIGSTDCRCRRGAAVVNLAHSASFHSREKIAPSNPGTKHLDFAPCWVWLDPKLHPLGDDGRLL